MISNGSNEASSSALTDQHGLSAQWLPITIGTVLLAMSLTCHVKGFDQLERDVCNIAAVMAMLCSKSILAFFSRHLLCSNVLQIVFGGLTVIAVLSVAWRAFRQPKITGHGHFTAPLRPMIFPCRTSHTRLFPTAHSLNYSYLYVGVPVSWTGLAGDVLSSGSGTCSTWFSVHQEDYLARGFHSRGLQGKLEAYLLSQNVDPCSIAGAFLVTAPRFLGFSFNPVSFWYLYDADMLLRHMILEVNNTFDERRMYLLERDSDKSSARFKQQWKKDFHVSPFNDRDGFYSLSAVNPFAISEAVHVDNNIVLKDEDGKPKLVARVFSTENGIDASSFTKWQTLIFVLKWSWVGFMTNPRILREARILWVKKLQVFYRPEVKVGSIGRTEKPEEIIFERIFDLYLQDLAHFSHHRIMYIPAAGLNRGNKTLIKVHNSDIDSQDNLQPYIELEVLTPELYSQLARDRDVWDVLNRYCFDAKPEEKMACLNHEGIPLLPELRAAHFEMMELTNKRQAMSRLTFRGIVNASLRDYTSIFMAVLVAIAWLIGLRNGRKPGFRTARYVCKDEQDIEGVERAATTVLLADRLALGSTTLLKFYLATVRWVVIILTARQLSKLVTSENGPEVTDWLSFSFHVVVVWLCGR